MATLAGALGLNSTSNPLIGNYAAHHAIFNFVLAYLALSPRTLKQKYRLDHNVSPRDDIARFGEKAVQDGKITREQLNMIKRNDAAHANSMEHYPFFVASILFATVAKVPNSSINRACTIYSVSRVLYGLAYIYVTKVKWSYLRSTAWWSSNICCLYLLWQSAKRLSSGI